MNLRIQFGTALAAATLMALPLTVGAQTTTSSQSGQTGSVQSGTQTTPPYGQSSTSLQSPAFYLDQARKDLDNLSPSAKESDAGKDLERHFNDLRMAYQRSTGGSSPSGEVSGTSGTSGTTGSTSGTSGSTSGTGSSSGIGGMTASSDNWQTSYNQIQQILDSLNVPKSSAWMPSNPESSSGSGMSGSTSGTSGSTSGSTGSTGSTSGSTGSTSGSTGSTSGSGGTSAMSGTYSSASFEAADLAQLKQFREDIEMFYKALQQAK
jgi:hypothetical protein